MPAKKSRASRGFTLVELLAVVCILAVLLSLGSLAFSQAVMAGKRAKCASNMRQIGLALMQYAADNDGRLPPTTHSTGNSVIKVNGQVISTIKYSWIYVLADYLDHIDEIRVCPADEKERRDAILRLHATSYVLNNLIFDPGEYDPHYNRQQLIPYPSRTMIMFITNREISRTWDHAHCNEWKNWASIVTDIAVDRHRVGPRDPGRLNGSSNYLFADGHVENITARDLKKMLDSGINPGAVPQVP